MPPDHMTEYRGRRMKVKEVVRFLEEEYKRAAALKQIRTTPTK